MAKTPTEIRSLARSHTEAALNCLVGVMENGTSEPAKVAAANALLDRGWGKPTQPISGDEDNPISLIHRIERIVVRPSDSDG
jgi:hypothetical protein